MAEQAQGNITAALADYNQAIAIDPRQTEALDGRGTIKARNGDVDGALADFNLAIEIDPGFVAAYQNRATALRSKGDYAGAAADSKKVEMLIEQGQAH